MVDRWVFHQGFDGPAQDRLSADRAVLLRDITTQAFAFAGGHDESGYGHAAGGLGRLALSAKCCSPTCAELMTELKPISIGPVQIASPVILAPMTAAPDCPF